MANIRCNCRNRNLLFYNLTKNCYIKQSFNISKFIYHVDLDKNDGNIVMKITNIKDLGNQLIAYLKDGYTICSRCGKLIKIKSKYDGSTKYCDECARKIFNEQCKKNMKKIELQHRSGISGNILAKLGRNEYISMQSVEKICGTLNCTIDEIMKFKESK